MAKHCERLREALDMRDIKPSMLSYKTGISEASISHYLAGHYEPKSKKLHLMAKALKVSTAWLSGLDVPMRAGAAQNGDVVCIPVLGYVAAGIPIEAITDILDYEEIAPDMLNDGSEYFALRIKGDSMEPKISDGDVVIVRKQSTCDSGQVCIVCVNGDEATCKKVVRQENGILLVPNNPAFQVTFYSNKEIEETPITILGRVVELRAKF